MSKLHYFAHRYSDPSPHVRAENLIQARARLEHLRPSYRARGIVLSAPWLDWAEAGVPEEEAWRRIETVLPWHDGIVLDLDGAPVSPGMERERDIMAALGRPVEVVR